MDQVGSNRPKVRSSLSRSRQAVVWFDVEDGMAMLAREAEPGAARNCWDALLWAVGYFADALLLALYSVAGLPKLSRGRKFC